MRYLVTGGAGFIGSHLVEHLVARGEDVVMLDNFSTGRRENIAHLPAGYQLIEGSILDPETCARAVRGADFVLHQAAVPSVPRSVADPAGSHAANATGTLNMLIAARDAQIKRFVYAASSSAYGNTSELPKHEGIVPRPLSPYAAAKYTGECYCRAFHASYGLPTVALRYFNVFGPRQDPNSLYSAVIPKFVTSAINEQAPVIFGDGEQTRDFTNIANVVHANLLACEAQPHAFGDVCNIGGGTRVSINELWQRVKTTLGATVQPRYEAPRTGDVRDSLASLEHAHALIGYQPQVDFEAGLQATIDYFAREVAAR